MPVINAIFDIFINYIKNSLNLYLYNIMSYVYLLLSSDNATYVGATIDLNRRLRQHNKEIKGGAHATSSKVEKGENWVRACHVSGFPDWSSALQFEWRWKQLSRKLPQNMYPLERRMQALKQLLSLERPTTKALAYTQWPSPPQVNIEIDEASKYYK
jgi:predicted GIY-YIG superfamily endonuclease